MMALITFMALCVPLFCVDAAITLAQKPCGAKLCHFMEYCSSFNNRCESCEIVCNSTSHNYDQVACTDQCQDYLHETRYASASNFSAEIEQLRKQQNIILALTILLLVLFLFVHGFRLMRWLHKKDYLNSIRQSSIGKNKKKQIHPTEITMANPHTQSPKLNIRKANGTASTAAVAVPGITMDSAYSVSGMEGSTIHTVSTPISNRYPAEDSVDYAYDNAGLQVTPVNEKPRSETKF